MALKSAGLYIGAALVSTSGKRLKFKEKPLVNALDVIEKTRASKKMARHST